MDGKDRHELIEAEGVTFTCGVPTIWTMYLAHLDRTGDAPTTLKLLQIGGSAMPPTMAQTLKTRYNVAVLNAWGLTDLFPLRDRQSVERGKSDFDRVDIGERRLHKTKKNKKV